MKSNRRKSKRLRITKPSRIPIYLTKEKGANTPLIMAETLNISTEGMAILFDSEHLFNHFKKGNQIKLLFRFPGQPLKSIQAKIKHKILDHLGRYHLGVRFMKLPKVILHTIQQMVEDNNSCELRVLSESRPLCVPTCTFYSLCRKPIRTTKPTGKIPFKMSITVALAS